MIVKLSSFARRSLSFFSWSDSNVSISSFDLTLTYKYKSIMASWSTFWLWLDWWSDFYCEIDEID